MAAPARTVGGQGRADAEDGEQREAAAIPAPTMLRVTNLRCRCRSDRPATNGVPCSFAMAVRRAALAWS